VNNSAIFEKLVPIIVRYSKNESIKDTGLRFVEDLGINSARLVDIVLDIEDAFEIEIDDASADKINTVADAIALIEQKKGLAAH
jgi:acyl carrier protein